MQSYPSNMEHSVRSILFFLAFLPACIDVYLNPIKDKEDTGDSGEIIVEPGIPTVTALGLSPDPAFTNDMLSATATTDDGEGGSPDVLWAWSVNTVDIEWTEATLSGLDYFEKGDIVEVSATPFTEESTGSAATASITISNTAPTAPGIALTPDPVHEASDDLHCALAQASTDDDSQDTVNYRVEWDVDGSAYYDGFKTVIDEDTVPAADLLEGQTWTCTVIPDDGEEEGTSASASTTVLEAIVELAECTDSLGSVSAPTEYGSQTGGGTYGIGAWFADASPNGDSRHWVLMGYDGDEGREYPTLADAQNRTNEKNIQFDEDWMGTGHVAINGIIYTVLDDANTILSVDPDTGALQASAALPNAMVSGAGNYSYGGKSYIDLSADDGRLYAIYTTVAAGGNLVVSELDLTTLAVLNTWTTSSAKKADYASAFIACGVLYAIDDKNDGACFWCTEQSIDLAWNLATGAASNPAIPWTNPGTSGYISGVSYNPADGLIYVVRGGVLGTIQPNFQ